MEILVVLGVVAGLLILLAIAIAMIFDVFKSARRQRETEWKIEERHEARAEIESGTRPQSGIMPGGSRKQRNGSLLIKSMS